MIGKFKSPLPVVAGILLRSRDTQVRRAKFFQKELGEARREVEEQHVLLKKAEITIVAQRMQIGQLQADVGALENQSVRLPIDPVLPVTVMGRRSFL